MHLKGKGDDMSELDLFTGPDLSPVQKALALSSLEDSRAAALEKREADQREAARQERLETLQWAERRGGDPLGELQRARSAMSAYDDEVRDLAAQLEKATARRDRAQANTEYWAGRMQEVTGAVSRAVPQNDLLGPAKAALEGHREYLAASRTAWSAAQGSTPGRRPFAGVPAADAECSGATCAVCEWGRRNPAPSREADHAERRRPGRYAEISR